MCFLVYSSFIISKSWLLAIVMSLVVGDHFNANPGLFFTFYRLLSISEYRQQYLWFIVYCFWTIGDKVGISVDTRMFQSMGRIVIIKHRSLMGRLLDLVYSDNILREIHFSLQQMRASGYFAEDGGGSIRRSWMETSARTFEYLNTRVLDGYWMLKRVPGYTFRFNTR